jgi:hypothetical protein
MGEDERHQREGKRDRDRGGRGIDAPDREVDAGQLERLAGEGQRDEPDHVDRPDEEQERGDVGEPPSDRLAREPLLRNLGLRDVVDLLADRLATVRSDADAPAHEGDPDQDRQCGSDPEIDDRLVDGHVERADVEGNPGRKLELVRRVELLLLARRGVRGECHGVQEEELHALRSCAKYVASETPSSSVYANA